MLNELNKPKVLFIASNIPTPKRKSNKVVMDIAHRLSEKYDISVLHPAEIAPFPFNLLKKYRDLAGKKGWQDQEIKVTPFKYIRLFGKKCAFSLLPHYRKRIIDVARDANVQLVHAHYALPDGFFALEIHKMLGIPYVISFRDSDIKFLGLKEKHHSKKLIDEILSNANQIIVHNAAHKEILANAGFDSVVMPHGVDADFVKPKTKQVPSETLIIACVSEMIARKHIDWVVDAVKNYKGDKNITLKIAGEGPMREELEIMAGGAENIQFLGKIAHEEVGRLLEESMIFALPSVNETFGLVYMEAAAHQNAVIATKGTGIWGVFNDKEEMFYCDSKQSFAEMLYQLIDNDELRNDMAKKAYEKTAYNFTWDKIINRYSEIYKNSLNR